MNTPLPSYRLPVAIPLARPWTRRLRDAWQAWREAVAARRALRAVCGLSARTLADVNAPEDWWLAAESCRARDAMERSLLRSGIVSGGGW